MDNYITIRCKTRDGKIIEIGIRLNETIGDLKEAIINEIKCGKIELYFKGKQLNESETIYQSGLKNNDIVDVRDINEGHRIEEAFVIKREAPIETKEINIKFLSLLGGKNLPNSNEELTSLLKLCLLKEISAKIQPYQIEGLPDKIKLILKILKNGYTEQTDNMKADIKNILEKVKGSNIINFSRFVDNTIDSGQLNKLCGLLNNNEKFEINNIKNRLARYAKDIKIFDKEFAEAMKGSIMEFSVISVAVIEREDFEKFEQEKKKCPNRFDKLLFHGTGEEPVASIMTGVFKKSIKKCFQHGKGVYFSDMIDYCWFYGNKDDNRANYNKIPKKDETFTLIACSTYYDKKKWKHVYDSSYTPQKNEINFALANAELDTIVNLDEKQFYGTEYVIWDLDQICPFIGAKLKRVEFCCIWRDTNFSKKIFFDPKTDKAFKEYLKERMRYIEQYSEFNIYPCETSEEALTLVKRKKYNKIILLSNIGQDKGGKKFVDEARKIIGNDVIVLFSAYDLRHLDWVQKYNNALFSNDPNLFEEYLKCFSPIYSKEQMEYNILNLKTKVETYYTKKLKYNVKFNFDDKYINYPLFKDSGKYGNLAFD